jgi:SAM-dependent methyltransferase
MEAGLDRYHGEAGQAYFSWQNQAGDDRGRVNARKFASLVSPDHAVLDFGCGGGELLNHLHAREKLGVEVNETARAHAASLGIETVGTLAEVTDAWADRIVSNHALEHVPDPFHVLQELHRCLKPGGLLALCLPIDDWWRERTWTADDINGHLYAWTPLLLGNLLSATGFEIRKIWVFTHAWPPHFYLFDRALPVWAFDALCTVISVVRRRRQLMAVAGRP